MKTNTKNNPEKAIKSNSYTPGADETVDEGSASQNLSTDATIEIGSFNDQNAKPNSKGDDFVGQHTSKQGMSDSEVHDHAHK